MMGGQYSCVSTTSQDQKVAMSGSKPKKPAAPATKPRGRKPVTPVLNARDVIKYPFQQVECLRKSRFFENYKPDKAVISIEHDVIVISGQDDSVVKKVKKKVKTHCDQIKSKYMQIEPSVASLLTKTDTKNYIDHSLDIPNVPVTWEVDLIMQEECLMVYALDSKEAFEMCKKIMACVSVKEITIEESESQWFQDLLQNHGPEINATNIGNTMRIYTTRDFHDKYFISQQTTATNSNCSNKGGMSSKQRRAPAVPGNNGTLKNQSVTATQNQPVTAMQTGATGSSTQKHATDPKVKGVKEEVSKTAEPMPDYEGASGDINSKFSKEIIPLSHGKLKFLERYHSKDIDEICISYDGECETSGDKLILNGEQGSVLNVRKKIDELIKSAMQFRDIALAGKQILTDNVKENILKLEKDQKCIIKAKECKKPYLHSGWIVKHHAQKMNILYMEGYFDLSDVDVLLCPVSDQLVPIGVSADLIKTVLAEDQVQQLLSDKSKKFSVGDIIPVYDTPNLGCQCLLLLILHQSAQKNNDKIIAKLAEKLISFVETDGFRSICFSLNYTKSCDWQTFSCSLMSHLWNMNPNLNSQLYVCCHGQPEDIDDLDKLLFEKWKVDKVLDWFTTKRLTHKEIDVSQIKVKVERGSILDYDSQVDVIVNSVKSDLDLNNGIVSKKLVQRAGPTIQQECKKRYKDGINIGEIAVTKAGDLKCRYVFHVALYLYWVYDGNISIEILKTLMISCLKEAENRKLKSIAFPALGIGTLGYPYCLVAKTMFEAVDEYGKTNPSYLKTVLFVLFGEEEFWHFENVDAWRKKRKREYSEYDVPPNHLMFVQKDLETRILVSDRDLYRRLSYKELRVVFTENGKQEMVLEWDQQDGCYATKMKMVHSEDTLSACFKDVITLMRNKRFLVVDIMLTSMTAGISMQKHLEILIYELKVLAAETNQINKSRGPKVLPIINYVELVRVFVNAKDYCQFAEECTTQNDQADCKPKWHTACKKAFPFDVEVVGMETSAKNTLDKVLQDISSIETTTKFSLQIKPSEKVKAKKLVHKLEEDGLQIQFDEMSNIVTCEGTKNQIDQARNTLEKFEDKDVCFDMTEDDFTTLLYVTNDENWRSYIKKFNFEKGKACFVLDKSGDPKMVRKCIESKLQGIRQLAGIEVIPPSKIEDQFSILQTQVEDKYTGVFCFLSLDKKKIIIKGGSYEIVQQAKYMVEVNLGLVQQSGGRKNRKFAADEIGTGPVASHKVSEPVIRDGMTFKTKEGINVFVYSAGIGNLKVDTLVNAANKDLMHGGGIAYHISNAAGYALDKECDDIVKSHGSLDVGSCCSTTAGNLPYKSIIHAVGPMWHSYSHKNKQQCLDDLKQTVISALKEAEQNGFKSIAIPSISSGIFGVPRDVCAQQYYNAVAEYSKRSGRKSTIREIHFIDKDRGMCSLIQKTFEREFGWAGQKM